MFKHPNSLLILITLISLSSCKTQEEIQREKIVDTMSLQMVEGQRLDADINVRVQQIEEALSAVSGKIEESSYNEMEGTKKQFKALIEKLNALESVSETYKKLAEKNEKEIDSLRGTLADQKIYLEKVLTGIAKITDGPNSKTPKADPYTQAMQDYSRGKYQKALPVLVSLLENHSLQKNKRARVIHNLGMISFINNKNQDALVYFSKLFTEDPSSTYNANGLLFLAKTFVRLDQKDQAKQSLQQMIKKFPKHKKAKEAEGLLKDL